MKVCTRDEIFIIRYWATVKHKKKHKYHSIFYNYITIVYAFFLGVTFASESISTVYLYCSLRELWIDEKTLVKPFSFRCLSLA